MSKIRAERVAHPLAGERELVGEVGLVRAADVVVDALRIEPVPCGEEPGCLHRLDQSLGSRWTTIGVEARLELLPLAGLPSLDETEVEERDAAVTVEAVVARMRVAVEGAEAVHGVLGEAPDHLSGTLLGLGEASARNSSHVIPSTHSVVSTRSVENSGNTRGNRTHG